MPAKPVYASGVADTLGATPALVPPSDGCPRVVKILERAAGQQVPSSFASTSAAV